MVEKGELTGLMDEAVDVTERLSAEASSAHQQIDTWIQRAKNLSDRIESVGNESHTALAGAAQRIEKLDHDLAQEADHAKSAFDALTQRAREFEGQVGDLLGKLHTAVEHINGVRAEVHNRVLEESEHHKHDLAGLAGLVQQLEVKLEDHWNDAHDEIKSFVDQVNGHLDEFKHEHESLLGALDHFQEDHNNLFQELVGGMEQFSSHSGDLLGNLVSHVEGLTDQHTTQLATKFGSEVVEHLLQSSDPLSSVFGVVNEVAGGSHESFLGKFEEITGNSEQVAEIINTIKPALDLIEEML
jgi:chromosome segregation ATPase